MTYNFESLVEDTPILPKVISVLLNNDIFTLSELTDRTKKEIKNLKGIGALGLASIELFLMEIGLSFKKEERKKDELLGFKKSLIKKYLKDNIDINWGNELKAASRLLQLYPNLDFWKNHSIPFKLNSLYFFLSKNGKEYLVIKKKVEELQTVKTNTVVLQTQKVGTDIVSHKPKSIKDFLNES